MGLSTGGGFAFGGAFVAAGAAMIIGGAKVVLWLVNCFFIEVIHRRFRPVLGTLEHFNK